MNLPEPFVRELLVRASQWVFVHRIYLYGSRARGDHRPRSDIDLAFDAPTATTHDMTAIWAWCEERAPTLLPIDAVRLQDVAPSLRERILREGVVLHDRADAAANARQS